MSLSIYSNNKVKKKEKMQYWATKVQPKLEVGEIGSNEQLYP